MELNDILSLVRAGYTREEIEHLANPGTPAPEPADEPAPNPEPAPVQVVEPAPVPAPAPAPQPAQQEAQPTMADLMQSIAKLTSAVQANAIAQSAIPGGPNFQTPTGEDALAEIIRPTFHERK